MRRAAAVKLFLVVRNVVFVVRRLIITVFANCEDAPAKGGGPSTLNGELRAIGSAR
jgi:hypothetical protein